MASEGSESISGVDPEQKLESELATANHAQSTDTGSPVAWAIPAWRR